MHTFGETGPGVPAFLAKLWRLVEDNETNDLISWSSDGRSFIIQNQAQFAKELLPLNYKHNNMASFIRQLNMYGFHKISSIDNGGLKFDKDEMEFTHPCFQKDHPYLLEHIKRKIANPKQGNEKGELKVEAVNRVLTEVKNMRGRQDTLDSRFSSMKQENEALWREIAILRQKHLKQQQIVNKLIQFLVTIVQPQRGGLGTMGNGTNKRRYQLMINDAPQSSKVRIQDIMQELLMKKLFGDREGAVIQELGEALEEAAYENEADMMGSTEIPEVTSPMSVTQKSPYRTCDQNEFIEEVTSSGNMNDFGTPNVKQEQPSSTYVDYPDDIIAEEVYGGEDDIASTTYLVDHVDEEDPENIQMYDNEDILNTPLVMKELEKEKEQQQEQQQNQEQDNMKQYRGGKVFNNIKEDAKRQQQAQSILKTNSRRNGASKTNQKSLLTNNNGKSMAGRKVIAAKQSPRMMSSATTSPNQSVPSTSTQGQQNGGKNLYTTQDFISDEMPSDIFDDGNNPITMAGSGKQTPLLGAFNFDGGAYNTNFNINNYKGKHVTNQEQQAGSSSQKNLSLARMNSMENDLFRLSTPDEFGNHLESVQTDLETLKDLLRGEGYQLDANTLLGHPGSRLYMPSSAFDTAKLFGNNDDILGYDFPMNQDLMDEKKAEASNASQLMEYKPTNSSTDYIDLNELLYDDVVNQDDIIQ